MDTPATKLSSIGGYLEYCFSNTYLFLDSRSNDLLLFTDWKDQSLLFGTHQGANSTMRITSNELQAPENMYVGETLGVGASNIRNYDTKHRLVIEGESNSIYGPHMAFYTTNDRTNPTMQFYNNNFNDTAISFDCYNNGSNWVAPIPGSYQIKKSNSLLLFQADFKPAIVLTSNAYMGIGASNVSHPITVTASNGPHMAFYPNTPQPTFELTHNGSDDTTHSFDAFSSNNTYIASHSNTRFQFRKNQGAFAINASVSNIAPGETITDWHPAFAIGSNMNIGIGTTQAPYKFTIQDLEPHTAIYTPSDNLPLKNCINIGHDQIYETYDAYYTPATQEYKSSSSNGSFQLAKEQNILTFKTADPTTTDAPITAWKQALTIDKNNCVSIGETHIPSHRLTLTGQDPNIAVYTSLDCNATPIFQQLNSNHDNIAFSFDAQWDGSNWIATDQNPIQFIKQNGTLSFKANSTTPSNPIDWRTAFSINSNSFVCFGNSNPSHAFTVRGFDPQLAIYCAADQEHPRYHQLTENNNIIQSYDAFYQDGAYIASHPHASFQVKKQDTMFTIQATTNNVKGQQINQWTPAISVACNAFVGVNTTQSPTHNLTLQGNMAAVSPLTQSPVYEQLNTAHDDITISFDAYKTGSNTYAASSANSSFQFHKTSNAFIIKSSVTGASWSNALTVSPTGNVGINNTAPSHKLTITDASVAYYSTSNTPIYEQIAQSANDIKTYYGATQTTSASLEANFLCHKSNHLAFYSSFNVPEGSNIDTWYKSLTLNSNSFVGIGTHDTISRLTIGGESNTPSTPAIACLFEGATYPAFQLHTSNYDNISLNFNTYWDGSYLVGSSCNANFQIAQTDGQLKFNALDFSYPGANITSELKLAMCINSNRSIGLFTSNPEFPLDIADDAVFRSNISFAGGFVPLSNLVTDIGRWNKRFKQLYLGSDGIDMEGLQLQKDYYSGGLNVYDWVMQEPARVWMKELLIGNPADLLNNSVYLVTAASNGLQFTNVTSNLPPQEFSQLNNMYVTQTNVGIGTSNPEKTLEVVGNLEVKATDFNSPIWDLIQLKLDKPPAQLQSRITTWGTYTQSNPAYAPAYASAYASFTPIQYLTSSSNLELACDSYGGFTVYANMRFTNELSSNETVFSFSNVNYLFELARDAATQQIVLKTKEQSFTTPAIIQQDQWFSLQVTYNTSSNELKFFVNNSNVSTHAVNTPIQDMYFTSTTIGKGNIDLSTLYIFSRAVSDQELKYMNKEFESMRIKTSWEPQPPIGPWATSESNYLATADATPAPTIFQELAITIVPIGYTISCTDIPEQAPTKWTLYAGMTDTKYQIIDIRTSETDWVANEERAFYINTVETYKYYRLEIYRNNSYQYESISIAAFTLYGDQTQLRLTQDLFKTNNIAADHIEAASLTLNNSPTQTFIYEHPPVPISAAAPAYTTLQSTGQASNAFTKSSATSWQAQANTYSAGNYITPTYQTTIDTNTRAGEWIQIQLPTLTTISTYRITPPATLASAPTQWYLAGSTNGSTWSLVDSKFTYTWQSQEPQDFVIPQTFNRQKYNYFRFIVSKVGTTGTTAAITELQLFGEQSQSQSQAELAIKGQLTAEQLTITPNLPQPIINCTLANPLPTNSQCTQWSIFSQSPSQAPKYKTNYIDFNNTFLTTTDQTIDILDGLTIMALVRFDSTNAPIIKFGSSIIFSKTSFTVTPSISVALAAEEKVWHVYTARYNPATSKAETFKDTQKTATQVITTPPDLLHITQHAYINSSNTSVHIAAIKVWGTSLPDDQLFQEQTMLYAQSPVTINSSIAVTQSIKGPLKVQSSTYSDASYVYPPEQLTGNSTFIGNAPYGTGTYTVTQAANIWGASPQGHYVTSQSNIILTLPEDVIPTSCMIATTTPTPTWSVQASQDGVTYTTLATTSNTTLSITTTTPYNSYQFIFPTNTILSNIKLYAKTTTALSVTQDNKVTVLNKLETASFYATSSSVMSGLKIVKNTSSSQQAAQILTGLNQVNSNIILNIPLSNSFKLCQAQTSNEIMTVTGQGRVGINTSNPQAVFHVHGTALVSGQAFTLSNPVNPFILIQNNSLGTALMGMASMPTVFSTDAGIGDYIIKTFTGGKVILQSGNAGCGIAINSSNNYVGIKNANAQCALDVAGDINFTGQIKYSNSAIIALSNSQLQIKSSNVFATDNTADLGSTQDRWKTVYSVNGVSQTSDSLEKICEPLNYGLDSILQVETVKYKWRNASNSEDEYYGVLADQIDKIYPELVYKQKRPYQINYSELIPICINAIKDLNAKINQSPLPGTVTGFDAAGNPTNVWSDAVTYGVLTTNTPLYSGVFTLTTTIVQAQPGDYIVPTSTNKQVGIKAIAPEKITFAQYRKSVGQVYKTQDQILFVKLKSS